MAAENLIATLDEDRQQGDFAFDRDVGGAVFHFTELAGRRTGAFRMNEQDIALLDLFLGNNQAADGVAKAIDGNAAADPDNQLAEEAVLVFKVLGSQAGQLFEVGLRQKSADQHPVDVGLVVGCDNVRDLVGDVIGASGPQTDDQAGDEKAAVKAEVADHTTADRITALLRLGNHCCRCRMGRHSSLFV